MNDRFVFEKLRCELFTRTKAPFLYTHTQPETNARLCVIHTSWPFNLLALPFGCLCLLLAFAVFLLVCQVHLAYGSISCKCELTFDKIGMICRWYKIYEITKYSSFFLRTLQLNYNSLNALHNINRFVFMLKCISFITSSDWPF